MQELRSESESSSNESLKLSPKDQLDYYKALDKHDTGETRYIVPTPWFSQWLDHCRILSDSPGPIDMEAIADEQGELASGLRDGADYMVLPEHAWNLFDANYSHNGTPIKRAPETELLHVYVVKPTSTIRLSERLTVRASSDASVNDVIRKVSKDLQMDPTQVPTVWYLKHAHGLAGYVDRSTLGSTQRIDNHDDPSVALMRRYGCAVDCGDQALRLARDKQRDYLTDLFLQCKEYVAGDEWYVIPRKWTEQWESWCEADNDAPLHPIHMDSLYDSHGVRRNMVSGKDYDIIPEAAWDFFVRRFGIDGEPILRRIGSDGSAPDLYNLAVDIDIIVQHPLDLAECTPASITVPDDATFPQFKEILRRAAELPSDVDFALYAFNALQPRATCGDIRLFGLEKGTLIDDKDPQAYASLRIESHFWAAKMPDPSEYRPVSPPMLTSPSSSTHPFDDDPPGYAALNSSRSEQDDDFSFSNVNGYMRDKVDHSDEEDFSAKAKRYSQTKDDNEEVEVPEPQYEQGLCGLVNMGNTCYMNSALQCLSNTKALTGYFLDGTYKHELNRDNPMGMRGELAEAYGDLIKDMWSGKHASIAPRSFKHTISRFNSTFLGFRQHDSQELLSFLLDGLHEDLNRIIKKPYVELPDFDGMPDAKVAMRCWEYHKARNDSIIVDLFQGQFKSRLTCQECGKISIMFDPFMYLSLPLPVKKTTQIKVVYVPYDPSQRQRRMKLTFQSDASIEHLQGLVAQRVGIDDPSTLLVTEIYDREVYKVHSHYEPISGIAPDDEIYVYQLPTSMSTGQPVRKKRAKREDGGSASDDGNDPGEWIVFPVYCATSEGSSATQFGGPLILAICAKDATASNLYRLIVKHVERFTAIKLFEEVKDAPRDESMDLDPPQQKSIHTSAAVIAAGGRRMEPMGNLFTMKVFTENLSSGEALPTGFPLNCDLRDMTETKEQVDDPNPLPFYVFDSDEDARMEPPQDLDDPMMTDGDSPRKGESDEELDKGQSPPLSMVSDDKQSSTAPPASRAPTPSSWTTAPPKPLIKQGEGIVIAWLPRKAKEIFGGISNIDTSAWNDIEADTHPDELLNGEDDSTGKLITLADCLNEFTREEMLENQDLWYCPQCKKHQRAQKKIDLWYLPEFMVIHLKRFSSTRALRDKIDALIDFPVQGLDMDGLVASTPEDRVRQMGEDRGEDNVIYDLYAVDNHFGGMGGGHYTAFAQNPESEQWCKFNDSQVSPVSDVSHVRTEAAYLLFYKRRRSSNTQVE